MKVESTDHFDGTIDVRAKLSKLEVLTARYPEYLLNKVTDILAERIADRVMQDLESKLASIFEKEKP